MTVDAAYAGKATAEQKKFAEVESIKARNADIAKHVVQNYRWPRFEQVFGAKNPIEFYALPAMDRIHKTGCPDIASIGSGDCVTEINVAKRLKQAGVTKFVIHCIDFTEEQILRADRKIRESGLEQHFRLLRADFNEWVPDREYASIMAHYVLHHVLNLEGLFSAIRTSLAPGGAFCTCDVIGRNGHRRWPETLQIVNDIWDFLPEEKKFSRFHKKIFKKYLDQDCSIKTFEGIRAQDILPLCIKNFGFEASLFDGGIAEIFYSAIYGGNFDRNDEKDRAFIDFVCRLNDTLIDCGAIKPTQMFAVMTTDMSAKPKAWRHWTPEFCVRPTTD